MNYDLQTYIYGMVLAMQKTDNMSSKIGATSNLLENRTLMLKVPRQTGKSYLINALALQEYNPIIFRSRYSQKVSYQPILRNYSRSIDDFSLRGETTNSITAVFFDEIRDTELIENVIKSISARHSTITYALALYT